MRTALYPPPPPLSHAPTSRAKLNACTKYVCIVYCATVQLAVHTKRYERLHRVCIGTVLEHRSVLPCTAPFVCCLLCLLLTHHSTCTTSVLGLAASMSCSRSNAAVTCCGS